MPLRLGGPGRGPAPGNRILLQTFRGFPTVTVRYVNAASTGGDGTTPATSGASAAYASLNAALTAMQSTDWQGLNQQPQILCQGSTADTVSANFSTTWIGKLSSNCFLEIIGNQPTPMIYSTSHYRIEPATDSSVFFNQGAEYLVIRSIAATATVGPGAAGYNAVALPFGVVTLLDRLRLKGVVDAGRTSQVFGISFSYASPGKFTAVNCVIDGWKAAGVTHRGITCDGTADCALYNISFVNCERGAYQNTGSNVLLKNCGTVGGTGGFVSTGSFAVGSTNNASDVNTDDTPATGRQRPVTPTFVDSANGRYHLVPTDTAWKDNGTSLQSDTRYSFAVDGDNIFRPTPWDIGADEMIPIVRAYGTVIW